MSSSKSMPLELVERSPTRLPPHRATPAPVGGESEPPVQGPRLMERVRRSIRARDLSRRTEAGEAPAGATEPSFPRDDRLQARLPDRPECPGARLHRERAEPRLGDRHHVRVDGRGLAVSGGDSRPVLAARGGLGDERDVDDTWRSRRWTRHSRGAPRRRPRAPLRSRQPLRESPSTAGAARHGAIECSMSRKGDCWDNAVAESFFASLNGARRIR